MNEKPTQTNSSFFFGELAKRGKLSKRGGNRLIKQQKPRTFLDRLKQEGKGRERGEEKRREVKRSEEI